MAQLIDRDNVEEAFAKKLGKLSAKHRKELERYLGTPPDVRNVPQSFWQKVEDEQRDAVLAMLLLIFIASSEQHGFTRAGSESEGLLFSQRNAARIARVHRQESKRRLDRVADKWAETREKHAARIDRQRIRDQQRIDHLDNELRKARADSITPAESPTERRLQKAREDAAERLRKLDNEAAPPLRKRDVRDAAIDVMGPKHDRRIAVTATTQAAVAGGEFGIGQTVGYSEDDTWFTEDDERVCPICLPLHGKFRRTWSAQFPDGPPAHSPGSYPISNPCRCWVHYAAEKLSRDDKVRFKHILKSAQERGAVVRPFKPSRGDFPQLPI